MSAPAITPTAPTAQLGGAVLTADVLPSAQTMVQAAKIAIEQDRAIMLDYYRQTVSNTAFLGEDPFHQGAHSCKVQGGVYIDD